MTPLNPPRQQKCPINDLPNELLSYVFQLGVEIEQEERDQVPDYARWKDIDDEGNVHSRVLPVPTDSDSEDDQDEQRDTLPLDFQVLVSHVCRLWRSVAINTHQFWTTLSFRLRPRLIQTKEYISRSDGLPLTIEIDCYSRYIEDEEVLSFKELKQIFDLLEPASPQWRNFIFFGGSYHITLLMSRMDKIPAAPCLESFKVYNICTTTSGYIDTRYLPFNGQAPKLKEAAFRAVDIDWEGALPNFLRGLQSFEMSYPRKNAWPTYVTFVEIIENSPELRTLKLSRAGPVLAKNADFDSHEAWGPVPLTIPSLTKLVLRFHVQKYAIALVQHLDMPNVTHLELDLDTLDYSDLVQALAKPVKGRDQSLLRQITHLNMTGLSFDSTSIKVLLSELISLKSLHLQPSRGEDEVVCDALVDPKSLPIGPSSVGLPKSYCPKLEEIATSLSDQRVKVLIAGRRDAGVPLKRIRRVPKMLPTLH